MYMYTNILFTYKYIKIYNVMKLSSNCVNLNLMKFKNISKSTRSIYCARVRSLGVHSYRAKGKKEMQQDRVRGRGGEQGRDER